MVKGKCIIVSAPSGAGKSTLIQHLFKTDIPLGFSISATSRAPRGEEQDGKDYFFLSVEDFKKKIKEDAFLEWEEVYEGTFYGTLKQEVENIRNKGVNVIFDVDVVGGLNIKKYFQEDALSLFIQPPSVEELEKRLIGRNTDTLEKIKVRIAKAEEEIAYGDRFDMRIVNDELAVAAQEIERCVRAFISA